MSAAVVKACNKGRTSRYQIGSPQFRLKLQPPKPNLEGRWLIIAVVLVAACPPSSGTGSSSPQPPTADSAALAAWKDFPAKANPRPIIVFSRALEYVGPAGFSAEPRCKKDWFCNKFVLAADVTLPAEAPGSATAGGTSYRALGAVKAYSQLLAFRARTASQDHQCSNAEPFVLKNVRWQAARFPTDRGSMLMSAWIFDVQEVDAYIGYSAVNPSAFWHGDISPGGQGGRLTADGFTLTLYAIGGPDTPGPCGEDFAASAAESDSVVEVTIATPFHTPPAGQGCSLEGHEPAVSVRLSRPLGGRVLIDAKGEAGPVCIDGTIC